MSDIKAALYQHLSAAPAVSAIVSGKIYPGIASKAAVLPYITYQRVSSDHVQHIDGRAGIAKPRMQVNCWADDGIALESLVEAVRLSLDGFIGAMGTVALAVKSTFLENIRDDQLTRTVGGNDVIFHKASMEFVIWHVET